MQNAMSFLQPLDITHRLIDFKIERSGSLAENRDSGIELVVGVDTMKSHLTSHGIWCICKTITRIGFEKIDRKEATKKTFRVDTAHFLFISLNKIQGQLAQRASSHRLELGFASTLGKCQFYFPYVCCQRSFAWCHQYSIKEVLKELFEMKRLDRQEVRNMDNRFASRLRFSSTHSHTIKRLFGDTLKAD
ncbi:hypothetical protein Plhal304r1_c032g0102711 [Plasmopara halstedii]